MATRTNSLIYLGLLFISVPFGWLFYTGHLDPTRVLLPVCQTTILKSSTAGEQTAGEQTKPLYNYFHAMPSLEDLSPAGDHAWDRELLTPSGGFLMVRRNETAVEKWGVSMFHGLHCLQLIRLGLQRAQMGMDSGMHEGHSHSSRDTHHADHEGHLDMAHLQHCFSYVAQLLTCAADDTIEPPVEHYDRDGNLVDLNVDGLGVRHKCRDPTHIRNIVERSEGVAISKWGWREGDTVGSVFMQ